MTDKHTTRGPPRTDAKAPVGVEICRGCNNHLTQREGVSCMATVPYFGGNGNRCPRGHQNCPCFIEGSSMTYNLVINDVRGIFGWSFRTRGYKPSETWREISRRLKSWRYAKGL